MRSIRWGSICVGLVALFAVPGLSDEPRKYGTGVALSDSTPITAILGAPARFEGKTVRVEGTVTAVCAHEGCWMALAPEGATGGPTLRLKVDDGVIVFPVTARGHRAAAQGVVERVGTAAEANEAAGEHAKQTPGAMAETSRNWQIKATGAIVY